LLSYSLLSPVLTDLLALRAMPNFKRQFAKLYDAQVDKIYRFVFLKIGSKEIAEDLTAQVFSKGWKEFRTGKKIQYPSAYLYQIARTEIANYYRRQDKYQVVPVESRKIIDQDSNLEEKQQITSELIELRQKLQTLDSDYQTVLILRYIEGLPYKKIAQITKKPANTARVMVHRALKALREEMTKGVGSD